MDITIKFLINMVKYLKHITSPQCSGFKNLLFKNRNHIILSYFFIFWTILFYISCNDVFAETIQQNINNQYPQKDTVKNGQEQEEIFIVVEEMPIFDEKSQENKDRLEPFMKYLNEHVVYPANSPRRRGVVRVPVQFDIDIQGNVVNVNVLRSVAPVFDAEAIRVVSSSPRWTPGRQNGKAVKVRILVMVEFKR